MAHRLERAQRLVELLALHDVRRGLVTDSRIGNKFLYPGCGYGGSCFPKDTQALARTAQEYAAPIQIVETVIKVNDEVKRRMIDKVVDLCGGERHAGIVGRRRTERVVVRMR